MIKLVDVLAELVVFPEWLAANPKEWSSVCEPQRGCAAAKSACDTNG